MRNCTRNLTQVSGTCYYNSVFNGIFLSDKLLYMAYQRLLDFLNSLKVEDRTEFYKNTDYCVSPTLLAQIDTSDTLANTDYQKRLKIANYAFMLLIKNFLCNIEINHYLNMQNKFNEPMDQLKVSIQQTLSAKMHSSSVWTEGGFPPKVLISFLKCLYKADFHRKVHIYNIALDATPRVLSEDIEVILVTNYTTSRTTVQNDYDGQIEKIIQLLLKHIPEDISTNQFINTDVVNSLANVKTTKLTEPIKSYVQTFFQAFLPSNENIFDSLFRFVNDGKELTGDKLFDKLNETANNGEEFTSKDDLIWYIKDYFIEHKRKDLKYTYQEFYYKLYRPVSYEQWSVFTTAHASEFMIDHVNSLVFVKYLGQDTAHVVTGVTCNGEKGIINSQRKDIFFEKDNWNTPDSKYNKVFYACYVRKTLAGFNPNETTDDAFVDKCHQMNKSTAHPSSPSEGGKSAQRGKLETLTVKDLQARCIKRNIKYSGLRKAELIAVLRKK